MSRRRFLYQHPADDLAKSVTPTLVTGSIDANYPLSYLANDNPALPAKFTATTIRIVWDLGSAVAVPFIVFPHWNVRNPASAFFEAHTANTWGGPDISTAITLTSARENGYWPYPFLDRSALQAKRYVSLVITDNPEDIVIGGVWLGAQLRAFVDPFGRGLQRPTGQDEVTLRTNFNVEHSFSRALTGGITNATMMLDVPDEIAVLQAWGDACRWGPRPVPVVFDDRATGAGYGAQFVKWNQSGIVPELQTAVIASVPVSFRDVSPGEAWD